MGLTKKVMIIIMLEQRKTHIEQKKSSKIFMFVSRTRNCIFASKNAELSERTKCS